MRREFGKRNYSAQRMLDELLSGKQIPNGDSQQLQTFILALEKTYRRAVDTGRESTFDSQDTINSILRKQLDHLIPRWSVECGKRLDRWDPEVDDESTLEFTFCDFLAFLRKQNRISIYKSSIKGPIQTEKVSDKDSRTKPDRNARIAAAAASTPPQSNPRSTAPVKKGFKSTNKNAAAKDGADGGKKTHNSSANDDAGWTCCCCGSNKYHTLDHCRTFAAKNHEEKFSIVKSNGLCLACLNKGHMSRNCTKDITCNTCPKKHHPLMHRDEGENETETL